MNLPEPDARAAFRRLDTDGYITTEVILEAVRDYDPTSTGS